MNNSETGENAVDAVEERHAHATVNNHTNIVNSSTVNPDAHSTGEESISSDSAEELPELEALGKLPPVFYAYDERMLLHQELVPSDHPECPARLRMIMAALEQAAVLPRLQRVPARRATEAELGLLHTPAHLQLIQTTKALEFHELIELQEQHDSLYLCGESEEAAALAAGCTIEVMRAVMEQDEGASGISLVWPPGHHAEHDRPMGFCLYNNVAVALQVLKGEHPGALRCLIVDWDVHHGNGTQRAFAADPDTLFISLHRGDLYPLHSADEARPDYVGEAPALGR